MNWREVWSEDEQPRIEELLALWERVWINRAYWRIVKKCLSDLDWNRGDSC